VHTRHGDEGDTLGKGTRVVASGVGMSMIGRGTAEDKLAYLRELILNARAMPMSASCVINRGEVLAAIDDVIANLPDEIADAQQVIDMAAFKIAEGEAEAGRIMADARDHAANLAQHSEVVRVAEQLAAQMRTEADTEAAALRRETDEFIDARMASFESVLHKTVSQVRTARARLSERSGLDAGDTMKLDRRAFPE
jgi:F0F1-type ATP synthase membrane subunit b/b'